MVEVSFHDFSSDSSEEVLAAEGSFELLLGIGVCFQNLLWRVKMDETPRVDRNRGGLGGLLALRFENFALWPLLESFGGSSTGWRCKYIIIGLSTAKLAHLENDNCVQCIIGVEIQPW